MHCLANSHQNWEADNEISEPFTRYLSKRLASVMIFQDFCTAFSIKFCGVFFNMSGSIHFCIMFTSYEIKKLLRRTSAAGLQCSQRVFNLGIGRHRLLSCWSRPCPSLSPQGFPSFRSLVQEPQHDLFALILRRLNNWTITIHLESLRYSMELHGIPYEPRPGEEGVRPC